MTTITLTHPSEILLRDSFTLSSLGLGDPQGICTDGTNWFVVNFLDDKVYKLSSDLSSIITSYDIGALGLNDAPLGIEWNGSKFFVTDNDEATVYEYPSDFSALDDSHDIGALGLNDRPYGLCWNGSKWFVVDYDDGIIYEYASDWSSLDDSHDIGALGGNDAPIGICWDGTYFWATDADGYLYQYPSDFSTLTASYDIGLLGDNDLPLCIDYDGTYYYIVDNLSPAYKYEYLPDTDITAKTKNFMINHPLKRTPTARGQIFNQALEYDDIIKITGNRTSYLNSKIDQNGEIYKDTLDFRDEIIGSVPAQTGQGTWTDSSGGTCTATIIDKFNEHAYVLQLLDNDGGALCNIKHTFTSAQTSGTIEFNMATTDITKINFVGLYEGANSRVALRIDDSVFEEYSGGGYNPFGPTPTIRTWFHIRIDFECGGGAYLGLSADTCKIHIDGTEYGPFNFVSASTNISVIQFLGNAADSDYIYFIDAIGYSWDTDYTVGDNKVLEVTLADQTLFEGRVVEEGSQYVKDIKLDSLSVEGEEIHPGEEGTSYDPDGYASTANYTEEVIAETINDKCSKITATLTDEIYRGTYSLENDTNATTPMGIVDDSAGTGTLEVLTASLGSHKNYIHIDHADANHGAFKILFEAQTTGVVEWIVRTTDVATGLTEMNFYDSGAVVKIKLVIRGSKHKWYDGVALTVGSAAATNTWYSYRLSFDCTTDTFSLWVDGNLEADGADFFAVSADIGQFRGEAAHDIGNPSFDSYFDAIGFSWDKFYTEASDPTDLDTYQNSHIYIPNIEAGGNTVDFSLQGEFSIERLASTAADLDVNIWKYSPDHAWLYDSGTLDNQITLTKYCKNVRGTDFLERYNTIITKGGWNAGSRVYGSGSDSDAQTTYGKKTITRLYTAIDEGATPLNTIAASILALQGNTPKIVTLEFRNTTYGMFAVGETITVPASTILYRGNNTYLDAGNWLISSISYDCIRDVNIMRLINTLFFEYNYSLIEELETLANG